MAGSKRSNRHTSRTARSWHHRDRSGQSLASIRDHKHSVPGRSASLEVPAPSALAVRVAVSASCRLCGRSRFGVDIGPRIPRAKANRCVALAVFRFRCFLKCVLGRVTTESELSCAVAVGVGRPLSCKRRRRTRKASSVHASGRTIMRGSSAGQPRRLSLSSCTGVRRESCAAVFPFLPARRSATRKPRTVAALPDAAKLPTLLCVRQRSWGSLAPFAGLLPHAGGESVSASPGPRAVCPHPASPDRFHRAESRDDSVLVGQRDSFAGDGFGFWASLPSVVTLRKLRRKRLRLLRVPALSFVLFQVCGHGGRASSWSRHRNDREPLIRLPGSDPLLGFWRSLCADVSAITTGKSTSSSCCLSVAGPSAFYEARAWPSRR